MTEKQDRKLIRKNDLIIMGCILLAALILFLVYRFVFFAGTPGNYVSVCVNDGEDFYEEYPLEKDAEIDIPSSIGTNHLSIRDGKADMTDADCPDKICVDHRPISANGESIICLPAKIVVTVISKESPALDSISQ